jgi:hypothetical protein
MTTVNTPKGQIAFPKVFRPEMNDAGKENYSCTVLVDNKEDISNIKAMVKEVATEKWGAKLPKPLGLPFKDGNEKDLEKYPNFENKIVLSAKTQFQPQLIDERREEILDETAFYAGCEGRMAVSAYAWSYRGTNGVSLNLVALQKTGEGERIGGRRNAVDLFDAVESTEADVASDDFDL